MKFFGIFIIWLTLSGCTRPQGDSSTVSLALPPKVISAKTLAQQSAGALNTEDIVLSHVVVNITGPGIPSPLLITWDKHNSTGTAPTGFTIDVPKGNDRLIQVLGVYQSSVNDTMTLYYGDLNKSLSSATESAEVRILALGGSTPTLSGQISGRYLTTGNAGPTGDLAIKFNPGSGKPRMLIERSTIYNGWFSVFGLSSIPLEYEVLPIGGQAPELLFGGAVTLMSPWFNPNDNNGAEWSRRLRAATPTHIRNESYGSTQGLVREEAKLNVWGYWGNAVARTDARWASRNICRDNLFGSLNRIAKYHPTLANWSSQPSLTITTLTTVGQSLPSIAALTDTTVGSLGSVTFLGGSGACTTTSHPTNTKYVEWISVSPYLVNGNGGNNSSGFYGPFRMDANMNWISVDHTLPKKFTLMLLPGVGSVVDSVKLYKNLGSDEDFDSDNLDCARITSDPSSRGFIFAGEAAPNATGTVVINSNINAADIASDAFGVLCPMRAGKPYLSGAKIHSSYIRGFSQSGMANDLQVEVPTHQASKIYSNGICVPIKLNGIIGANKGYIPQNTLATLSTNNSTDFKFYSDPNCSGVVSSVLLVGESTTVFFKSTLTGPGSPVLTAVLAGGLTLTKSVTIAVVDAPGTPTKTLVIRVPPTMVAHQCYLAEYEVWHDNGTDPRVLIQFAVNSDLPSTNIQFYGTNSSPCTGTTQTNLVFGTTDGTRRSLYFTYTGTAPTFSLRPTTGWIYGYSGGDVLPIAQPGPITNLSLSTWNVPIDQCVRFRIETRDSNNNRSPVTGATNVNIISSAGGAFYPTDACSTSTTSVTLNSGTTGIDVYYKATTTGPKSLTASTSTPFLSQSVPLNATAAVATELAFVLPGQTINLTTGVISGTPIAQTVGTSFLVEIYAIRADGTIDTNFSGQKMTLLTAPSTTAPNASTLPFVNGLASFSVTPTSISAGVSFAAEAAGFSAIIGGSSSLFNIDP